MLRLACLVAACAAHPEYVADLPNGGAVKVNNVIVKALGHVKTAGGGSTNQFGALYKHENVHSKGWGPGAICCADTDLDGFTNGMELGDPCCTWKKGQAPDNTTDLSHPSIGSSKPATRTTPACVATVCKKFLAGAPALRGAQ